MRQTLLPDGLQHAAAREAALMYPECTAEIDIPLVIALPAGIHPYNRNSGYFDKHANAIVLYQELGRKALRDGANPVVDIIRHELAHWYQRNHLGYETQSKTNVHRVKSWSEACFIASTRLWPDADLDRKMFNYRRRTGPHLSDVQLHHWPSSMPQFMDELSTCTSATEVQS